MALPNFLIIGAAKAGTTSLYHYLRQHPDVYMSPVKEPRYYWSEGQAEGLTPFRTRDEYERLFDGVTSERAVGEASPQYLNSAATAERIAADIPAAKLIVSLRNPAERAYSSYLGRLRGARERYGLDDAMRPGTYYFETSLYHPRLTRYFERFDRRRIKVIVFEDFVANTGMVLREIHEFLEIDPTFVTDVVERHNPAMVPRSITANEIFVKTAQLVRRFLPRSMQGTGLGARAQQLLLLRPPERLPGSIRLRLLEQFREDINRTSALVGRDLSDWLVP
jgi:hypothetical protein